MYFLQSIENDKAFYLINKSEFIVGRKNGDILIENDTSISRRHAKICVKDGDSVTLQDLKSKYKTFVNGNEIDPDNEVQLSEKDKVQFGGVKSIFTFRKFHLVTTATQLSSAQKEALKKQVTLLQGRYQENWDSNCTHLTLEKVSLTVKVLHALLEEKPIVIPEFWTKFVKNVNKNLPPPKIENYNNPPLVEALINEADFKNSLPRKGLFRGKTFVFATEKEKNQVATLIEKAGGSAISWEKNPVDRHKINQSSQEFLIMQSASSVEDNSYKEILKYLSKQSKRTIPMQEIAMAIVHGTCEKDCNPNFNRGKAVFGTSRNKEPTQHQLLVQNTQTQNYSENLIGDHKVIPETIDSLMSIDPSDHRMPGDVVEIVKDEIVVETSKTKHKAQDTFKRPAEKVEGNNPFKKIRLEAAEIPMRRDVLEDRTTTEPSEVMKENPFKSRQTQKRKVSNDSDEDTSPTERVPNPFRTNATNAKKNRRYENIDDEMPSTSSGKRNRSEIGSSVNQFSKKQSSLFTAVNESKEINIPYTEITPEEEAKYSWSSKDNDTTKIIPEEDHKDIDLQRFVNMFEVQLITEANLIFRAREHQDDVDYSIFTGAKNVKKFKKVKHPRPQMKVINYKRVTVSSVDPTDDNDEEL